MVQVRLENVTKIFLPGERVRPGLPLPFRRGKLTQKVFDDDVQDELGDGREEEFIVKDKIVALDKVDLLIKDGETMSIVGPSGCGKSTLLRVIAGLENVNEGKIYFDNDEVTDLNPKDRGIGMVFQNYALYPHMKSRGNLAFFFRLRRRPEDEIDEKVKETSKIMGIGFDMLLGRMPKTLAGGEKQRVALGRCIVRDPKIFLLDEPISNLDAKLRAKTRVEIKRLLRKFKITTAYVTHDQVEAMALASRMAVMRHGKIVQVGSYNEIYEKPKNTFIAGFIGLPPMNLFVVTTDEKRSTANGEGFTFPIPSYASSLLSPQSELVIGIRPEKLRLRTLEDKNYISGEISQIEPLPSERVSMIYVEKGKLTYIAKIDTQESRDLRRREKIELAYEQGDLYFFNKDTGDNLLLDSGG